MNVSKVRAIERDTLENFDILKGAMIYHYIKNDIAELTLKDNKIEILLEVGVVVLDSWKRVPAEYVGKAISFFLSLLGDNEEGKTYGELLRDMIEYDYDLLFEEILGYIEDIVINEGIGPWEDYSEE